MDKKIEQNLSEGKNNNIDITSIPTIMLDDNMTMVVVGSSSVIGKRSEQQDAILADKDYAYVENKRIIAVLCDGMGGLRGGAIASQIATAGMYQEFLECSDMDNIPEFYIKTINSLDEDVSNLKNEDGSPMKAGTTLTSIIIKEGNLFWASVGDSHIYIIRNNEILCVVKEHNYKMILDKQVSQGKLSVEEANKNPQREALISYIGMGGVRYIDLNTKPFQLISGDYIVMCSDGLYRTLEDDEIKQIVFECEDNVQSAAEKLTGCAIGKGRQNQDNTSAVVIRYMTNW